MGGAATGGNAQLFELMNQYGTSPSSDNSGGGMDPFDAIKAEYRRQERSGAGEGQGQPHFNLNSMLFAGIRAAHGASGFGANGNNSGSGSGNKPGNQNPVVGSKPNIKPSWRFPKYSQTWAFTPPPPSPIYVPKPFDPAIYGDPFSKKPNK